MIAVVCAMSTEVEPIKAQMNILKTFYEESAKFYQAEFSGLPITIVQTGVGRDRAKAATECLLRLFKIHLIISTGFAGSLQEEVNAGDLIVAKNALFTKHIGHMVQNAERPASEGLNAVSRLPCETSITTLARNVGDEEGLTVHVGDIVTADEVIKRSEIKMLLGKNLSSLAVDMETAFVGQIASGAGIPFVCVRSVSDDVRDNIVVDYKRFVDECGNVRLRSVLSQILYVIPNVFHLRRMHKQSKLAADTLAAFLPHFIAGLYNESLF